MYVFPSLFHGEWFWSNLLYKRLQEEKVPKEKHIFEKSIIKEKFVSLIEKKKSGRLRRPDFIYLTSFTFTLVKFCLCP